MTHYCALLPVIQSLELQLHQAAVRNDPKLLDKLLHADFQEIGRSGQCYDKRQSVAALLTETQHQPIFAEDFNLAMIAEGVALLRYRSFQIDDEGKKFRNTERSSIWLISASTENGGHWQLRYHQGTGIDN